MNTEEIIHSFFNIYNEDFNDYIEKIKNEKLAHREDYAKIDNKIEQIQNKYPNLLKYLEDDEIIEFSDNEKKALLEIIELQYSEQQLLQKEIFKLGFKEALVYFKEMGMLNF